MKSRISRTEKGIALFVVVVFVFIFGLIGFAVLRLAETEMVLTRSAINETKAFYLAEAGLHLFTTRLYNKNFADISDTALAEGKYNVELHNDEDPPYIISTGTVANAVKRIKVEVSFLSTPYECGVYAGNSDGQQWMFSLRGQGDPQPIWGGGETGGKDVVNGNVFVDGDVSLYEESSVNPSPMPNPYQYAGDVSTTGTASILDSASVSGAVSEGADSRDHPSLVDMNYSVNNTHNVSRVFADEGISTGHLPSGHELRDVVVKNPGDRAGECAGTAGDDYFLEPVTASNNGADQKDAKTPLHLGDNRIYYIDGDVWVHSKYTYGFLVDGKVTIIATGDIHISDNIKYADSDSLLGLVALGQYDSTGQLVSGGNIYFGDPQYGTMYTVSGLMFAADSFLYNTNSVTGGAEEPQTGFSVYGNLNALNQVSVLRDWYDPEGSGEARPAYLDPTVGEGKWKDMNTGTALTGSEIDSLRHYQMKITYDDRVRTQDTQPPGLPRGQGTIFGGLKHWQEVP